MVDKAIFDIEIKDDALDAFKQKHDEFNSAVAKMPAAWASASTEIEKQTSTFEKAYAALTAQHQTLDATVLSEEKFGALVEGAAISWASLHKSGKLLAANIFSSTQHLRHWSKLTGLFAGIVGAGGLLGISKLAMSVSGQRTTATGLGVTPGELASFTQNYARLGDPGGILSGFSEAEADAHKKYALRQYLGHDPSGDPAKDFTEGLGKLKKFVDQFKGSKLDLLGPQLSARGYDKLGITTEIARIVQSMSETEVAQIQGSYRADLAGRLGLSDKDAKKWQELIIQLGKAEQEIQTVFAKRVVGLTAPLEHLSKSFVDFTAGVMKDDKVVGFIKSLGVGIKDFAESIGTGGAQAKVAQIGRDVGDVVHLFDSFISSPGGKYMALLGLIAAKFGFVPAAGTALYHTLKPQPLNEGEDEQYRQLHPGYNPQDPDQRKARDAWRETQPGTQGKPGNQWKRGALKPEPVTPGDEYQRGEPGLPSAGPTEHRKGETAEYGSPWNRSPGAPLGEGMGQWNFMHGQFGGPGQNLTRITTEGGHTVTVNKEAAPHFKGFLEDLEASGAPIHQNQLGGFNDRTIAGSRRPSQHAYGNAVDIDSTGRNVITADFADWARAHDKELRAAENKWGIRAGRDMSNPDMGHWEWGGGSGNQTAIDKATSTSSETPQSIRARSLNQTQTPSVTGHHPATVGLRPPPVSIMDNTGGAVMVVPH